MVKTAKQTLIYTLITALVVAGPVSSALNTNVSAEGCLSTNTKCLEAEAAEKEAREKADAAAEKATTLEGEVARLGAEIGAMEAKIAANQAKAEDLSQQIAANEQKLAEQQEALAGLLVQLHFSDKPDAVTILAGSKSLSDFAERQARAEAIKSQIALSAQAVKAAKEQLELQKAQVEALVADQENQRTQIAANQAEQARLVEQYKDDSAAFEADAEEARKQKEAAIAEQTVIYNGNGIVVPSGVNTYPYAADCPAANLTRIVVGGYICQCVSYTGWKVQERWGYTITNWGNAKSWGVAAAAAGFRVDDTPAAHTVAYTTAGDWGHVMWVEAVNDDGTIELSEYNNSYSAGHMADYGHRNNVPASLYRYIHFD